MKTLIRTLALVWLVMGRSIDASAAGAPGSIELARPTTMAALGWGDGPSELLRPGTPGPGEGIPTSFLVDDSGRLHILDAPRYRILPDVAMHQVREKPIDLLSLGLAKKGDLLIDFAMPAGGGYVVLEHRAGTCLRVGPDGRSKGRFGMFSFALELGLASDGKTSVRDNGVPAINLFSSSGAFESERRDPSWTVFRDSRGRQYRQQLVGPRRIVLSSGAAGQDRASLVATVSPVSPGNEMPQAKVIGIDAADRVYLQTIESAQQHWTFVRILRFLSDGSPAGEIRIALTPEEYTMLPRFFRPTPAGDILTFRTDPEAGYRVLRYSFPK